jgi:hypothetical protein
LEAPDRFGFFNRVYASGAALSSGFTGLGWLRLVPMIPWPANIERSVAVAYAHVPTTRSCRACTCPGQRLTALSGFVMAVSAVNTKEMLPRVARDVNSGDDLAIAPRCDLSCNSMSPRAIRTLTEAEVIRRWAELYAAGKHKGYAPPLLDQYLGRDATWVEVEVPHDLYDADWNTAGADLSSAQLRRAEEYASRPGPLPPGMASFNGRRARRGTKTLFVPDGNHRAYAAFLRGSPTARFYMPQNEWQRFQRAIES